MLNQMGIVRVVITNFIAWLGRNILTEATPAATPGLSIFIRELDTGSCNAGEAEITALTNPYYDIERFGFHFVASPRHADILLVTGPCTRNMVRAAVDTFEAMPEPRRVVTVGDCSSDSCIFNGSYAIVPLPEDIRKCVVMHVSGCPPTPEALLKALVDLPKLVKSTQRTQRTSATFTIC